MLFHSLPYIAIAIMLHMSLLGMNLEFQGKIGERDRTTRLVGKRCEHQRIIVLVRYMREKWSYIKDPAWWLEGFFCPHWSLKSPPPSSLWRVRSTQTAGSLCCVCIAFLFGGHAYTTYFQIIWPLPITCFHYLMLLVAFGTLSRSADIKCTNTIDLTHT